jgi:hypothetical protein
MTKEELLVLMQEDRKPIQQILEVIDFRPSDRNIEGELYLVTAKIRTINVSLDGVDNWTGIVEDLPYPLGPSKAIHDGEMEVKLKKFKLDFDKIKKSKND